MIAKKAWMVVAAMVLGVGLAWSPATAKKGCGKLCKNEKADCIAAAKLEFPCKDVPKELKKECKRGLKAAKKACKQIVKDCKAAADDSPLCSSPSPAFLD